MDNSICSECREIDGLCSACYIKLRYENEDNKAKIARLLDCIRLISQECYNEKQWSKVVDLTVSASAMMTDQDYIIAHYKGF